MCGGGGGGNSDAEIYALDLAYGTNLSGKNPGGGKGSIERGQEYQAGQSALERAFQSGEAEKNAARQLSGQKDILGLQQGFQSGEAEKAAARELAGQKDILGLQQSGQKDILGLQQLFQSGEAEKAAARELAGQKDILGLQQGFTGEQNALNRALQERGLSLQEQGLGLQEKQFGSQEEQRRLAQEAAKAGETGFLESTSQPSSALEQLAEQIRTGKNRDIQEAENQTRANLYKSGVRGSRAASLIGQQTGQLTEKAMTDINNLKSQDEIERQKARQAYYSQKALSGYGRS